MTKKIKQILIASSALLMLAGIGDTSNISSQLVHARRINRVNYRHHIQKRIHTNQLINHHNYVPKKKRVVYKLAKNNNNSPANQANIHNTKRHLKRSKGAWDIINYAKSQIGKHRYSEGMGVSRYSRNGMLYHPKNGRADCASFAYFVYRHCGYKVPAFYGNAWAQEGSVVGPKRVRASKTEPGSIVQNPIHMVILEEKYRGPKTKVIEEGGYWNGGNRYRRNVNEGHLGGAFKPDDGHYIFYNPVKAHYHKSYRY